MNSTPTTGRALTRARELSDLGERQAAKALRVNRATLRAWETDDIQPDTEHLQRAVVLYGADLERIWPDRQPLTSLAEPGVLIVGDERIRVADEEHRSVEAIDNHTVLARYLAAVRRQRGLAPNAQVELRSEDISSLATVLDLDDLWLESELVDMLQLTPAGARWTMRAMFVGTLMSAAAIGLTGCAPRVPSAGVQEPVAGYTLEQELDIGVIETSAIEVAAVHPAPVAEPASADSLSGARHGHPFTVRPHELVDSQLPPVFGVTPPASRPTASRVPPPIPEGMFTTQPNTAPRDHGGA